MSINESEKIEIEVFRDGSEIVFRFYGISVAETMPFIEDVEFMQGLMDQCNEEGDFIVEIDREEALH